MEKKPLFFLLASQAGLLAFPFHPKLPQGQAGPPDDRRPAQPLSLANPSARGEPPARSPSPSRAPSRRERAALTLLPIHFSPSSRSLPHPAPTPCPRGPAPPRRPCSSFAAMAPPPPSPAAPLQLLLRLVLTSGLVPDPPFASSIDRPGHKSC